MDPLEELFLGIFFEEHFENVSQLAVKFILKIGVKLDSVPIESFVSKLLNHTLFEFFVSFNLLMEGTWAKAENGLSAEKAERTLIIKH